MVLRLDLWWLAVRLWTWNSGFDSTEETGVWSCFRLNAMVVLSIKNFLPSISLMVVVPVDVLEMRLDGTRNGCSVGGLLVGVTIKWNKLAGAEIAVVTDMNTQLVLCTVSDGCWVNKKWRKWNVFEVLGKMQLLWVQVHLKLWVNKSCVFMVEQLDAVKVEVATVECGMMEQQSWLDVVTQPRHFFFLSDLVLLVPIKYSKILGYWC